VVFLQPFAVHPLTAPTGLSSPDFLHKLSAVVKTTTGGKVGKSAKGVDSFYVNQK